MSNNLKLSVSPHIHSGNSTSTIMLDVIVALLPATVAGCIIFGLRSCLVLAACIVSCVLFEFLYNLILKKEQTIGDFSAVVTGLLLGLNLPANIPIWQCIIGSFIAIIIVKCLFGGIGCNIVNPAITARVFMLVSFGTMTTAAMPTVVDTVAGATPLSAETIEQPIGELFLGLKGGAIGETCILALVVGLVYLLIRKVISWHIPLTFISTVYICSFFMEGLDPIKALAMILSGGLFIGAIFMATDYVTSPSTAWGKVVFGVGAGLLTFLIRYFGDYPEGVSFAILFFNILTPYIEKWTKHKVLLAGGKKA